MSTKVRVYVRPGGRLECVNASLEKVSVRGLNWEDFVVVRPNTRFEGDFRDRRTEPLAPVALTQPEQPVYPAKVRRATEDDIDALSLLVPQILAETEILPISPAKVERLIERCATRQGGAIAGVIDGPDGVDASVGLDVCESPTSDQKFVKAVWLGLHPSLRNEPPALNDERRHLGKKLFEFARWYHQMLEQIAGHPVLMQFDVATRVALGPKVGFYERNAPPVGATFAYLSSGNFLARGVEAA